MENQIYRVYAVDLMQLTEYTKLILDSFTNDEFIYLAESQVLIWSLPYFEMSLNNNHNNRFENLKFRIIKL